MPPKHHTKILSSILTDNYRHLANTFTLYVNVVEYTIHSPGISVGVEDPAAITHLSVRENFPLSSTDIYL